jgi:ketosteroid isomerase-like protein
MPERPPGAPLAIVSRFNDLWNARDLDGIMALMTADCVFENTHPPPDGERHEGQAAVRAAFERFFRQSPHARFEWEETDALGDRAIVRWRYAWVDEGGRAGHIRGVDIFRLRGGLIAEKLSYVKG